MPSKPYNFILDETLHAQITRGSYDSFEELKRRYHKHATILINNLLEQYTNTGLSKRELVTVCDDYLVFVVTHYVGGASSFYAFWQNAVTQEVMDYLMENSYGGDASSFSGTFSLNQSVTDRYNYDEILSERDEDEAMRRKVFEVCTLIARHQSNFTSAEINLLSLTLKGYSIKDLVDIGIYKKSSLYLTFKSAVKKLKKLIEKGDKK